MLKRAGVGDRYGGVHIMGDGGVLGQTLGMFKIVGAEGAEGARGRHWIC